jgi:hypothetical protein
MHWYRTNRTFAGTLALFALALQITLSFGHVHLRDFVGIPGVEIARAPAPEGAPAGNDHTGHSTDDYCLICATANLAGTLVVPDPGSLLLLEPFNSTGTSYGDFCSRPCSRIEHALFLARAPPLT